MIGGPQLRSQSLDTALEAKTAQFAPGELPTPQPSPRTRLDGKETLTLTDNESIASILLKLERSPTSEVAIVAAPGLRVFRNPVSMRLLQRKAEDLGLEVTVISQDEMTRNLCAEIGFNCWSDVDGVGRDNSTPRRFEPPLPALRAQWVSVAAALCLLVLIFFIGWFVLPAASITITPASAAMTIDVPVIADSTINSIDLAAGKIPARVVTSGDVEGSSTVSASGQRAVPNQPAHGFVTFTNLTDRPLTVPKNTVLLAGKTSFFTLADTQVGPSLKVGDTAIPGAGSAAIQATEPGADGNVGVGAITGIDGVLASKVSVVNHSATTGGSNKKASYLSSDDQAKAKQGLLNELRQQALDRIRGQIARNETFLPSPASDGEGAVEELTYAESPEQVTGQTTLHMKVLVRGLAFQGDDVNQVVSQAMDAAARKKGNGAQLADAPLVIQPPAVTGNDGTAIKLQVHATGRVSAPLDSRALANQVRGLSATTARNRLAAAPGVGRAEVKLWPAWANKVPSFAWRIHTTVSNPSD